MSNIKVNKSTIDLPRKVVAKTSELTLEQVKTIVAESAKKRVPAPVPKPLGASERLGLYNGVLSKLDPSKIIRIVPNPEVTLTPAAPRSSDGKGAIGLVTRDDSESCYWDTDPKFSDTGIIQMPNFVEGYIFLTFQTLVGSSYALELQLTMGAIPAQTLSGTWKIYGPKLSLYVPATPAQTVITGFKAEEEKTLVSIFYTPNYDPKTIAGGARFLSCKLTLL
jgi:hypothetical protein